VYFRKKNFYSDLCKKFAHNQFLLQVVLVSDSGIKYNMMPNNKQMRYHAANAKFR
jgi:hypothetical protein